MSDDYAVTFPCDGETLVGICSPAEDSSGTAVVIVVGGPQYRVGSHRHFVMLARDLAAHGFPSFRFDMRGMGDSSGEFPGFEAVDEDIRAGLDAAQRELEGVERFVLWGLCDAASAILFYAHRDPRVAGIVLANPWVRTVEGESRARLRHYYVARLLRADFWRRLVTGDVDLGDAVRSFAGTVRNVFTGGGGGGDAKAIEAFSLDAPLPERMAQGFAAYSGPSALLISGNDLTAREFVDATERSPVWSAQLARPTVTWHDLPEADHTFSQRDWTDRVAGLTIAWLRALPRG